MITRDLIIRKHSFDIIMILITVRIYNSDILITGLGQNKTVVRIQKMFTKRGEHEDE